MPWRAPNERSKAKLFLSSCIYVVATVLKVMIRIRTLKVFTTRLQSSTFRLQSSDCNKSSWATGVVWSSTVDG